MSTRSMTISCLATVLLAAPSPATIIAYDASIGVLPYDPSLPPDVRFDQVGDEWGFSSVANGVLTIADTSTVRETKIYRTMPPTEPTVDAAYQITTKVIWANRPGLNMAGSLGFKDERKLIQIAIAPDEVGFINRDGSAFVASILMDTTDAFHTYRVLKHGDNLLQLFVDDMMTPLLEVPYSTLVNNPETSNVVTHLWQGSNNGQSEVQITNFAYNASGLAVPEPSTALLAVTGGLASVCRRRKVAV